MSDFETDVIERLTRIEEAVVDVKDHETRIRAVELKTNLISGGLALVAPVLAFFGFHATLH